MIFEKYFFCGYTLKKPLAGNCVQTDVKTGNAVEYGHFTTDDKVQYCLNMDDYENKKANGESVDALDTLVYLKSKSAAGYELDRSDMSDLKLSSGIVLDGATDAIKENLEANIRVNSREEVLASLAVLDKYDSGDAKDARSYLSGVREEERNQKIIQENQYLADFKELDRSKTEVYLESQSFENQHPIAASFLNDPADTVIRMNKELLGMQNDYLSRNPILEYSIAGVITKAAYVLSPSDANEFTEMLFVGGMTNEALQVAGKSLEYMGARVETAASGLLKNVASDAESVVVNDLSYLTRKGEGALQDFKFDLQLFAKEDLTTVGRWMSKEEYKLMEKTGKVQESLSGTTHVAYPANIEAFSKQAKPGSLYVEFDVPVNSVKPTSENWGKIIGPNSLEGRLAEKKGLDIPQMPSVENVKISGNK